MLLDDLCWSAYREIVSLLVLLDHSLVFDTPSHGILLVAVLQWFCSFLMDWSQKEVLEGYCSTPWLPKVLQDSIIPYAVGGYPIQVLTKAEPA